MGVDLILARAADNGYVNGVADIDMYQKFVLSARATETITIFLGIVLANHR